MASQRFHGEVLPPPEELKHLPLDVLINILSSARPLHRVLRDYLRRRKKDGTKVDGGEIVDPHKRVDTSQFLLQRTRRISWALKRATKTVGATRRHPGVPSLAIAWSGGCDRSRRSTCEGG